MDASLAERSLTRRAAALLAAALLASACAPAARSFLLHPLPPAGEGYALAAGALVYRDKKVEAELRPLDPKVVQERLDAQGRLSPFVAPGGATLPPLVFELRILAAGKRPVYFNPSQVRGLDDDKNRYYPLGFTDFYQLLREDPEMEERLGSFKALCWDQPAELKPGEETVRYLALTAPETAPEELAITLPLLYDGKETITPAFSFEGFPVKEEKKP